MAPTYATTQELANELGVDLDDLPANAANLLRKASRHVDYALIGAIFETDDNGIPTDSQANEAIKNATLAQVSYWLSGHGDEHGESSYQSVSIGSVSLQQKQNTDSSKGGTNAPLAPQAMFELSTSGLLPISPLVRG